MNRKNIHTFFIQNEQNKEHIFGAPENAFDERNERKAIIFKRQKTILKKCVIQMIIRRCLHLSQVVWVYTGHILTIF